MTPAFEAALSARQGAQALEALVTAFDKKACWPVAARDEAYTRLLESVTPAEKPAVSPVGFDRPSTLHLVGAHPMLFQQHSALLMMLHTRPAERHVVMFTGPEPDPGLCNILVEKGAFVLSANAGVELFDRWHWLRGRFETLLANRVVIHASAGDVLAGLVARLVASLYGPRLYLLHHGQDGDGLIPDLIGTSLTQATHLVAAAAQKQVLRAAFEEVTDPVHMRLARLPAGVDHSIEHQLDGFEKAGGQAETSVQSPQPAAKGVKTMLRATLRRMRHEKNAFEQAVVNVVRNRKQVVSATCADLQNLPAEAVKNFATQVVDLLEAGVTKHVHIGLVADRVQKAVEAALHAAGYEQDKVLFTGGESSLRNALIWHKVGVFLDGLPGIQTLGLNDVAASGVPIARPRDVSAGLMCKAVPALLWSDLPDLLNQLQNNGEEVAQAAGDWHKRHVSLPVFRRRLKAVLAVTEGAMRDDLGAAEIRELTERLFDRGWYLLQNQDVAKAGVDPLDHYLKNGEAEGRAPCALFHPRYYAANLDPEDQPRSGLLAHYLAYGEAKGHSPHPLFSPRHAAHSLERAFGPFDAGASVLEAYLSASGTDVAPHPLFDPVHYAKGLALQPEDQPLLLHFLETGAGEGLSPHPLIEADSLAHWPGNPAEAVVNWASRQSAGADELSPALLFDPVYFCGTEHRRYANAAPTLLWAHLIEGNRSVRGPHLLVDPAYIARRRPEVLTHNRRPVLMDMAHGRLDGIDTHPLVSVSHILAQAPWVAQTGQHPTRYFTAHAARDNLDAHPYFSTQVYLVNGPDVAAAGLNPLLHYLIHGQYEGRLPHLFFDGNDYYKRYLESAGGDSPLLHYIRQGAGAYLPVLPHDGMQHSMGLKTARATFTAGAASGQPEAIAKAAMHPDWGAPHPTLEVRHVPLAPKKERGTGAKTLHGSQPVSLSRPAVMAGAYIAPPAIEYVAPAVTAACWSGATVIGGNDGFLTAKSGWHLEGPEQGPLPDTLEADDADLALRPATSIVALRKDSILLRHFHSEQGLSRAIFACGSRSQNFDHFMLEVLPRVLCAADLAPSGTPILAEDDMPDMHRQALRLALPDYPVLQLARGARIKVAQLYAASMGSRLATPKRSYDVGAQPGPAALCLHPALVERVSGLADAMGLIEEGHVPQDEDTTRRLFIYTKSPSVRGLINRAEVGEVLSRFGFGVLDFDQLSFVQLIRAVAQADDIVITDGPQVAALAFARPGARIFVLLSNASGTDFHRADLIGRLRGARVVNCAGWMLQGSAGTSKPPSDAHFTLPLRTLEAFFASDRSVPLPKGLPDILTALRDLSFDADVLTGAWAVLAGETPAGFALRVAALRRAAVFGIGDVVDARALLGHDFFTDYGRNLRSGFTAFGQLDAAEQAAGAEVLAALTKVAQTGSDAGEITSDGDVAEPDMLRKWLMHGMLLLPNWQVPLPADPQGLPEDVLERWLHWASLPPFLGRAGEDAAWVAHVARLLDWIADGLDATAGGKSASDVGLRKRLMRLVTGLDLGQLLLVDVPLNDVQKARNRVLEHVAVRSGTPRMELRNTETNKGQKTRIGVLCRTFEKGPDSEAVVAFFQGFDRDRYEIYAYSVGFRDRVVSRDPEFDVRFDATVMHRRELPGDPSGIRSQILADDLDVFLYANATTYGIQPMDIALYHRVAPVQAVLNSHVPMAMGYPSFDAVITGQSDDPAQEVAQSQHSERLIRVPGPVISYLTSFEPRKNPVLDRASLGLLETDIVMMNAGSSMKLRHESLRAMMRAVVDVPAAKLLLAPYNPGWAARSLAFAFNLQVAEVAAEVGLDPSRIVVLGELSVAEAEAALSCADIYLNPFPHGGATMTHLALIYGVPPVTLRRGSTRSIDQFLISALGFEELLASSVEGYVALAQKLAGDPELRETTAARLRTAARNPVFVDSPAHSKDMQAAVEIIIKHMKR